MERAFITLFLILFVPNISSAQIFDAPAPVMCWNVENYFDTFDNPNTADDEFTPMGDKHWSRKRFQTKRNAIAKTIISVGDTYGEYPFLVGLVEVECSYVLKELVTDTPLTKLGYKYLHRDSHDPRGIECALLYRESEFIPLQVKNISIEKVYPDKPLRHILYVKGVTSRTTDTLHIFVNHWSSKLGGAKKSEPNRMASALRMVQVADSVYNSTPEKRPNIIIMGDFNDTCDSRPLKTLLLSKCPMSNLSEPLYEEGRGTIKYQGEWDLIDHFVVSSPLEGMTMEIYSPDYLLEEDSKFLSRKPARTYNGPRYLGGVSDHLPIILKK